MRYCEGIVLLILATTVYAVGPSLPFTPEQVDALRDQYGAETAKAYRLLYREMTQQPETHPGIADKAERLKQTFNRHATILRP